MIFVIFVVAAAVIAGVDMLTGYPQRTIVQAVSHDMMIAAIGIWVWVASRRRSTEP